jgi:hypothetical protein
MIHVFRWIGQLGYHVSMVILIVMTMFTLSFSALRMTEDPKPLQHFKVQSEFWRQEPPKRDARIGVDPWSINHDAPVLGTMPGVQLNRNPPLRL